MMPGENNKNKIISTIVVVCIFFVMVYVLLNKFDVFNGNGNSKLSLPLVGNSREEIEKINKKKKDIKDIKVEIFSEEKYKQLHGGVIEEVDVNKIKKGNKEPFIQGK